MGGHCGHTQPIRIQLMQQDLWKVIYDWCRMHCISLAHYLPKKKKNLTLGCCSFLLRSFSVFWWRAILHYNCSWNPTVHGFSNHKVCAGLVAVKSQRQRKDGIEPLLGFYCCLFPCWANCSSDSDRQGVPGTWNKAACTHRAKANLKRHLIPSLSKGWSIKDKQRYTRLEK